MDREEEGCTLRLCRYTEIALLLCVGVGSTWATAGGMLASGFRRSPRFGGTRIAVPPKQSAPWRLPETRLPKTFASATTVLFAQGLADPRGCEYREVDVATGSCWQGDGGVRTVHGWVLPAKEDEKQRFAICWNGLVYPISQIGKKADLRADAGGAIRDDEERRAKQAKERPDFPFYRHRGAISERRSVAHRSMLPLKACILLRLGEIESAERFWEGWTAGMQKGTNDDSTHLADPYIMLATDWTWALFDRAVCAHMRGDDNLALVSARTLVPIWEKVEAEAERRGFERPYAPREKADPKHLPFLEPIHMLLADQERRAKARAADPPGAEAGVGEDKKARIARLIRSLEGVSARQFAQPGGSVTALIKMGDAAVEPLLDCLESDNRLTRSVQFHRDFFRHRSLVGVHEAAYVALAGIQQTSFLGVTCPGGSLSSRGETGRRQVADEIRAHWERFRGVSLAERWYQILADDEMHPKQWLQAAVGVVRPADVRVYPGGTFSGGIIVHSDRKRGEEPGLRGEVLRAKTDPSVTALMAKRAADLGLEGDGRPSSATDRMRTSCDMALHLAKWDPAGAVPTLRDLSGTCRDRLHSSPFGGEEAIMLATYWARMASARTMAGDEAALGEYMDWLQKAGLGKVSSYMANVFRPLWEFRNRPVVAVAADRIFNSPDSAWRGFLGEGGEPIGHYAAELFNAPLICVPAFRHYVLRRLGDRTEAGTVTISASGQMVAKAPGGWPSHSTTYPGDPLWPGPDKEVPFRVCDLYAHLVAGLHGTPQIKLYWPEKERDRAVRACASFLKAYGSGFVPWGDEEHSWFRRDDKVLAFPDLEGPASKRDVAEGRAIFRLKGRKRRVWPMAMRPMKAKWITLKDYPYRATSIHPETGKREHHVSYHQGGSIWQAEEVLVKGEWQRFYGFVGPYCIAKVPAEEIEFSGGQDWDELAGGLDCRIMPPGCRPAASSIAVTRLGVGDPLVVQVMLRNRRGADRAPPFLNGLQATLSRVKDGRVRIRSFKGKGKGWIELETKAITVAETPKQEGLLATNEEFTALTLDLRDLFTITKPGAYGLSLTFGQQDGHASDGETLSVAFSLAPAKAK